MKALSMVLRNSRKLWPPHLAPRPAALALLALAGLMQAQDFGRGPGRGEGQGDGEGRGPQPYIRSLFILVALDTDHDGIISAAEIAGAPVALLTLDRNHDGQLTAEELRPIPRERPDADGSGEMVETFMAFDKNHDGRISKAELPERMQGVFDHADTNKDGFLTPDEIRTLAKAQFAEANPPQPIRLDPISARLDADHDNTLSASEIAHASAVLKTFDKNGDGQLTDDELRPQQGPGRGRGNPDEMISRLFTEFDKNGDGKLSRDEAAGTPIEEMFDRADQNKDGFITRDELRAALQQRGGPNGPPERH